MRSVLVGATLALGFVFALWANTPRIPRGLTVVMDFRGAHSDKSIHEMQLETASILKDTGIKLDWRLLNQTEGRAYPDLVVMTFRGACQFDRVVREYDLQGPLASTKTTDHQIQSFGQVDCDHVVSSARSAMFGGDFAHADLLVGRALGRVVTHELVHMLTGAKDHGHDGVFESGLSGRQLIAPKLPLSPADLDRLLYGGESEQVIQ
ncbi:MAG TPA: hypothetical protein VHA14_16370 [Bryobacteraceae bacterium]|nr:hypothetical protein [Bryobacteraceae bacterium]